MPLKQPHGKLFVRVRKIVLYLDPRWAIAVSYRAVIGRPAVPDLRYAGAPRGGFVGAAVHPRARGDDGARRARPRLGHRLTPRPRRQTSYLPCDRQSADLFYNVISRRHGRRSTVVTTNLAFKQWSTVFPGAACVGALVDRFSHQCHPIDIDADSWRNKESQTFHKKVRAKEQDQAKKPKA
jgi:hypothetical protein